MRYAKKLGKISITLKYAVVQSSPMLFVTFPAPAVPKLLIVVLPATPADPMLLFTALPEAVPPVPKLLLTTLVDELPPLPMYLMLCQHHLHL